MFWRKRRVGKPDTLAFFNEMVAVEVGEEYTAVDRYRDFQTVFLGTTQGRRVLFQIMEWCHLFEPSFDPGAADVTAFREGERNIGLQLFACMNTEPQPVKEGGDDE